MTLTAIATNSLLYRLSCSISRAATKYKSDSYVLKKFVTQPLYSSSESIGGSVILKTIAAILILLLSPLEKLGKLLRKFSSDSLILNHNYPATISQSHIIRAVTGIRVETALWLVVFYPVIDFLLRKIPSFNFLAGGWDELLLVFIILAWPVQMALRDRITYRCPGLDIPILV
ncbi:MAG: hypothetical protein ACYDEQ_14835, partial [Desulfocucumaceae bacterium]